MDVLKLPITELIAKANKVREDFVGTRLELCSIINAKSGFCNQDCKFCAQSSKHPTDIARYPLKPKKEILNAAEAAKKMGAEKFGIVTSGNRLNEQELSAIVDAISDITRRVDISICASLGALKKDQLKMLKDAGLSRYHHNIETSPRFYPQVVTTHTFQERIDTINAAKEVGLEVCSGGIIGMGETWQDRLQMARILSGLDVASVPINFLVPIKGTPFETIQPISCDEAIKTISIFRIVLKDKIIKIAAGRETILKDFQGLGFMAGANGMLIGGYLTIKGRTPQEDHRFVEEIRRLWSDSF